MTPRDQATHANFVDEELVFSPMNPELAQLAEVMTKLCRDIQNSVDTLASSLSPDTTSGDQAGMMAQLHAMRQQLDLLAAKLNDPGTFVAPRPFR